jgi:hypothetical protein
MGDDIAFRRFGGESCDENLRGKWSNVDQGKKKKEKESTDMGE